jgi:hypothetical protein
MQQVGVEAVSGIVIPRKFAIPPGTLAKRLQRYAVYLIVCCFALMLANVRAVSLETLLWFATAMAAAFALLCGVTAVILHAIQWKSEQPTEDIATSR